MSERREFIKKTLGIPEYPWSSDDEEGESQPTAVLRNDNEASRPSVADNPGTSGGLQSSMFPNAQSREVRGQLFWSLPPVTAITSRRNSTFLPFNRNRPNPSTHRDDMPLSLVSRNNQSQSAGPSSGSADVRRILAFRKIRSRQPTRLNINQQRPPPTHVAAVLERRSRPIEFCNAVHRARKAMAGRFQRQPAPASQEQPVNLSDDGFLEPELNLNRLMTAPPHDHVTNEIIINDEPPAEANGENNDEVDANDLEAAPEPEGAEPHNESAMSLEEVVEMEPGPTPADDIEPPGTEEPAVRVPNNSSASDEPEVSQPLAVKRKRDSDDDNTNDMGTVKEFNQNLLRLLECPVCLEWMEPPMWQCRRGHLVCGRCRARLAACPVCRTAFSSVRNRAMEGVAEMVRYPCRHGCGRDLQLRRRAAHEASCVARRYRCPAPACDTRPPLAHKDLEPHFRTKHLSMVKVGGSHKFSMRVNSEQHDNFIIMALQQLFHLRVDVDIRNWGLVVYVAYIGPKCNAADFTYEVEVTGQHNSRKLVYRRATHCDLECSTLNVSRQDCFHLTLEQALNFLRFRNHHAQPDKYLHFSVDITRNVDNENDNED